MTGLDLLITQNKADYHRILLINVVVLQMDMKTVH